MAFKISLKRALIILFSLITIILSACMNPVDIQVFMNDPQVQEVIAATKNPPASTPKVNIDPDSEDYSNLTAGDGTISGLTSGKYYMVEESNGDGVLTRTRFIKADGDNGATLDEIGLLEGTQITNLKNSFTYKITSAKPFDESATYEYFTFGDASSIKLANVSPNGGITTVAVIGTGSYCLDLKAVIKADKLYEVMMVQGTWTESRTSARYNSTPSTNITVIGTSYNDKYNSNKDIGVYQYDKDLYTGGLNTGINLKDRSIITELPAIDETKDYVFAEWSDKYTTKNAVTKFTFLRVVVSEAPLPPLTGTVNITGTAAVGQTLTADTSALVGTGTIAYQWKSGGENVGSNSSTYVVQGADAGKTITVTVTRAGYSGSVSSNPTAAVAYPALTGTVTITGTPPVVGQPLTANTDSLNGSGTISYQWKSGGDNVGTNSNTYTPQNADAGKTITVTVTRAENTDSVTSSPTAAVTNPSDPPLTGTVNITGTAEVGQTLTANTALDGTGTLTYQWKSGTSVVGTNSSTYTVQGTDAGKTITVTVSRAGYSGSITSDPTATVPVPPTVVNLSGLSLTWKSGPTGTPDFDTGSTISYHSNNTLDLVLKVTGLSAGPYSWYYEDDTSPFATGADTTAKFSVYSGVTGYTPDDRWFQKGYHTITLVTNEGSYQYTFNNP